MQRQSLILQPDIQEAFACKLVRAREAPDTQTVIDRHADDWLANLDGLFDDEGQVVTLVCTTTCEEKSISVTDVIAIYIPLVKVPP